MRAFLFQHQSDLDTSPTGNPLPQCVFTWFEFRLASRCNKPLIHAVTNLFLDLNISDIPREWTDILLVLESTQV